MRPLGSGLAGTCAALALVDEVHRHRLRRAALHLPLPGQERGPFYQPDGLPDLGLAKRYKQDASIPTWQKADKPGFPGLAGLSCCASHAHGFARNRFEANNCHALT